MGCGHHVRRAAGRVLVPLEHGRADREPLEAEFGWSRALTSGAITVNFILYGLTAPFAAALMERFGVRGVAVGALGLIAAGMGLTTLMASVWQLYALWGPCVGLGCGSLALVFGAIVIPFVLALLAIRPLPWACGRTAIRKPGLAPVTMPQPGVPPDCSA